MNPSIMAAVTRPTFSGPPCSMMTLWSSTALLAARLSALRILVLTLEPAVLGGAVLGGGAVLCGASLAGGASLCAHDASDDAEDDASPSSSSGLPHSTMDVRKNMRLPMGMTLATSAPEQRKRKPSISPSAVTWWFIAGVMDDPGAASRSEV